MQINKSLITNITTLIIIVLGWVTTNDHLKMMGYYAFSGAITNWLAIYMLFEKIPFLYGSGVIPNRFEQFREGIKSLIMKQFFTKENIERFFKEGAESELHNINLQPLIDSLDYELIFNKLVEAVMSSSLGAMLSMMGGADALSELKEPFTEKLKTVFTDVGQSPEFKQALAEQTVALNAEKIASKVESIVDKRLQELTPDMVKMIIQKMIREHLGWLVIWGGVFGGLIGLVVSFIHT